MSKIFKFILIISVLLSLSFNFSYATEDSESTSSENSTSESLETTSENEEDLNTIQSSSTPLSNSGITSVSPLSDYSEANLGLNNILNIILIAIGVLIILFAIAILIRLKS